MNPRSFLVGSLTLVTFGLLLGLSISYASESVTTGSRMETFETERQLNYEIKLSKGPAPASYKALCRLIDYAAPELLRVGSIFFLTEHNDWINKAAAAVRAQAKNQQALIYCLEHGSDTAKQWVITRTEFNSSLLPYIADVAISPQSNSFTKQAALAKLKGIPQYAQLLKQRAHDEQDPHALEPLLLNEGDFNNALTKLLFNPDAKIRGFALLFIGSDGRMGLDPKPNHSFNESVFDRIIVLTRSKSSEERANAAYALTRMRTYDPDQVREAFLGLARDADDNVRWRVADGLFEQRDLPEVKKVLNELSTNDPSPLVRRMTRLVHLDSKTAGGISPNGFPVTVDSPASATWVRPKVVDQFCLPNRSTKVELDDMEKVPMENVKWSSMCTQSIPFLIGSPVPVVGGTRIEYNIGLLDGLQAQSMQSLPQPADDPHYRAITFDPKRNVYYVLGANGLILHVAGDEVTALTLDEMTGLGTKPRLSGMVFDSKRDRLIVTGGEYGHAAAWDPKIKSWKKVPWEMWLNTTYYSPAEDSIYTLVGGHIYRLSAADGKILQEGTWSLPDDTSTKQISVQGNCIVAVSDMRPANLGFKQTASIVDKRDGTIRYRHRCYFVPKSVL